MGTYAPEISIPLFRCSVVPLSLFITEDTTKGLHDKRDKNYVLPPNFTFL